MHDTPQGAFLKRRILALPVMAGVIVVAAGAGPARADTDPNTAVTGQTASAASVQHYWTAGRIASATPLDRPAHSAKPTSAVPAPRVSQSQTGSGGLPSAAQVPDTASSPAFTAFWQSRVWSSHGKMPARTIGKLYLTESGEGHWCTATVITSANRNTIWTAGHCLSDGHKHWFTNFKFVPDYHDGKWPYGSWTAKKVTVPKGYFNGGNSGYDMGAVALNTSSGRRVGNVVGWQGYKFGKNGLGTYANVAVFGYPQNTQPARSGISPVGKDLRWCAGSSITRSYRTMHCDMGNGASGGPMVQDLQLSRGWGYVIGHESYALTDNPGYIYGPILGDDAISVWKSVQSA
jgi:V8-like Glu-specific endopeptidase